MSRYLAQAKFAGQGRKSKIKVIGGKMKKSAEGNMHAR